ncbi:MAG: CPBP family intramembrane metalloprotease [Solobacterium sp.]|nr:CPBP family intramembrane metalloprotease [Solobacterium sp.]
MRLALYYSLHTTWNQFRKLFRTWLFLILLGIVLGGGLIGLGAFRFMSSMQSQSPVLPESLMEFFDASGLNGVSAFELGAGLSILSILILQIFGAENSVSRLFLPADVNVLFTSDRSPQEVLSFRLFTTIGTAVIASVYLFFQFPSLISRFHITPYASGTIIAAWCMTLAFSLLLKILTFELCSRHPFLHRNLRFLIIGSVTVLFFLFYASYHFSEEQVFLLSAHRFFNAPWTRFIPVWGWLKGMMAFALEGNERASLLLGIFCLILLVILIILVRILPVDYYEEASIRCEEIALYMEHVTMENAGLLVTRAARRRDGLDRECFHHGSGASVFFFKPLVNRFRFARFGLFTRTLVTYSLVAAAGGLFVRMFMEEPSVYPPVAILAVSAFFRTIASPMSEDIRRESFLMIPENTWAKLACSLAGGALNCAMDSFLPLIIGSLAAGCSVMDGLVFLPFIVSIDLFATSAGTFVDAAIPSSIDKTLKQVLQIILLYLGMIPDEMILVFGLIGQRSAAAICSAVILNLILSALFLGLCGVWLNPCPGQPAKDPSFPLDRPRVVRAFSVIGFALLALYAAIHLLQAVSTRIVFSSPVLAGNSLLPVLALYLPVYFCAFVFLRLLPVPSSKQAPVRLSFHQLFAAFAACVFLMTAGNILGLITAGVLSGPLQLLRQALPLQLPFPFVPELPAGHSFLQVLFLTVCSPLIEELIFRRALISRLKPYGELAALIGSALAFGMFHESLPQWFYATLLGLVFGYLYLRTSTIRWSFLLHMTINAMGSLITPGILSLAQSAFGTHMLYEADIRTLLSHPVFLLIVTYLFLLVLIGLYGTVVSAWKLRSNDCSRDGISLREALASPGMACYLAVMVILQLFWLMRL